MGGYRQLASIASYRRDSKRAWASTWAKGYSQRRTRHPASQGGRPRLRLHGVHARLVFECDVAFMFTVNHQTQRTVVLGDEEI